MAEWFRCKPDKLLRGLEGLTDDGQLVYVKALLLVYENDGRISAKRLARECRWRPARFGKALDELLAAGKLIGTATGDLHNDVAMHELTHLHDRLNERAASGSKGGKVRAERERFARLIAERNRSPDLFEKPTQNAPKVDRKSGESPVEVGLNSTFAGHEQDFAAQNANEINGTDQAQLKHARAGEQEQEQEQETPLVSPPLETAVVELVEGIVEDDDEPGPRKRKQPMPPGWLPTVAALSEAVQACVATWSEDEWTEQAIKFIEWAEATDQRFSRWDRAMGNWCMKHHTQRKGRRHDKPSGWSAVR